MLTYELDVVIYSGFLERKYEIEITYEIIVTETNHFFDENDFDDYYEELEIEIISVSSPDCKELESEKYYTKYKIAIEQDSESIELKGEKCSIN